MSQDILLGVVIDGQSLNRYAYVQGNPVGFVDPLGLARDGIGSIDTKSAPPEETGYKPPKNADKGKKRIKAPGGRGETGWLDRAGRVWVPDIDMDGGEGWRRHYPDGSHDHVYPDGKVRTHNFEVSAKDISRGVVVVGGGYVIYRVVRLLPSLLPPLWPTIPANALII